MNYLTPIISTLGTTNVAPWNLVIECQAQAHGNSSPHEKPKLLPWPLLEPFGRSPNHRNYKIPPYNSIFPFTTKETKLNIAIIINKASDQVTEKYDEGQQFIEWKRITHNLTTMNSL